MTYEDEKEEEDDSESSGEDDFCEEHQLPLPCDVCDAEWEGDWPLGPHN